MASAASSRAGSISSWGRERRSTRAITVAIARTEQLVRLRRSGFRIRVIYTS
jgi:hypothetical protein